ncbi:molybdopterin oxidoreductase family protein [Nocardioides sp. GY 10113]|uniref:molybdopterin-dependent oxidoreductase n=1 Tax=Nocardioides sp. GY 10113 TaxID=2569761 RepID=UPI0010A890F5|nr:molybdopterin-dependent oxidoreductase [Nocardioides sp. GY 10113]TIC86284.1 molybdopterin oxidoreductase family protein [Nocardioides sp. GY 10113]
MTTPVPVTCPLCEATCGLLVTPTAEGIKVRGDRDDVFSKGYLCPKGASIGELHEDPDRLRAPLVKRDGEFVEVSWEEAYAEIERRLPAVQAVHGRDAVAAYFGNPTAHTLAGALYLRPLIKALGTRNIFSAGTVDQVPRMFVAGYLFGDVATIPVPDLDRTDYLLVLGGNPLVSNGSMMTAPDMRGRIRAIAKRGKVVVVDPSRTRTAEAASEHLAIRPGTDAFLLLAMVHTLFAEDLVTLGAADGLVRGVEEVRSLAADFPPEAVAERTGIEAETIRRLAREVAGTERAVVYGRMGTTTSAFGTVNSWLIDVINVLTGHLDRPGGAMFPMAAAGQPNTRPGPRKPFRHGRWRSRVSDLPEVMGELPSVALAEEISTPGEGQVRALITVCGNPVVSVPGSDDLDAALADLDFMVSLDVYVNETTRHADVILPGPTPLERAHYDLLLYQYSVRNIARWSEPVLPTEVPPDWHAMVRIAAIASGAGAEVPVEQLDDALAAGLAQLNGVEPATGLHGPERLLDILFRAGPYELTFAEVAAAPHGIDLGPLQPRLPGVLSTASGLVDLAPAAILEDVPRLREAAAQPVLDDGLVLIGRRHLRSNNSWMHNVPTLVGGTNTCTLHVHPDDATRLRLEDGGRAAVASAAGRVEVAVEVTDTIRSGVVSLPHGWGHEGIRGSVATKDPGVNSNRLGDVSRRDAPTGTAVVNGIPVTVAPV